VKVVEWLEINEVVYLKANLWFSLEEMGCLVRVQEHWETDLRTIACG